MNKDEREEEKRETPARNAALVRLKSHWLATWGAQYGVPATWDPKDEPLLEQFLAKCGDDVDRAVGVMARYVADDTDTFWRGHPFRVLATQAHRWIPKSPRARLAAVTAAAKANPVDALSPEELAMAKADFLLAYPKASPGTRSRLDGSPRSVPEFVEFVFKLQTPLEEARP